MGVIACAHPSAAIFIFEPALSPLNRSPERSCSRQQSLNKTPLEIMARIAPCGYQPAPDECRFRRT